MSAENVVPLNFNAECIRDNVAFAERFAQALAANEITTCILLAVDKAGEPWRLRIVPLEAPTLRLMLKGMLHDAIEELTPDLDEPDA